MVQGDERTIRRDVEDLASRPSGLKAHFVVIAGQDIGRKYPIGESEIIIGRVDSCDISINDDDVSRNHAKVSVSPSGVLIEDLGSTNGTLINGQKVEKHLLNDGDRIQIGNVTVFKFNFFDELEESFNEQLYQAANKDHLTGCYNKKYFLDRLHMEMSHTQRHHSPLSLILFDLDHFKSINDVHGHVAGDQILKEVAQSVESFKRHEDLFARYGGEEFVLLLRDTPKAQAVQIAKKICAHIEELNIEIEDQKIPVTVSIGLDTFVGKREFKNSEDFIRKADHQLYEAKKNGRNQVKFEADPE